MKTTNFFKKVSQAFSAVGFAAIITTSSVSALPYNGDNTVASPTPAFNVFTGVPSVGNEADFLRSRVPNADSGDTSTPYTDPLTASCANGQKIQLRVYVHNGASASANGTNGDGASVAHGTKVTVRVPTETASSFSPSATISSTNAGTVNDGASISCGGKVVKLKYVAGSAKAFAKGYGVMPLADTIVSSGVPIKSETNVPDGDVLGCWDERVYVVLSVQVEEVNTPPVVSATCDLLTIVSDKNRNVTITDFKYSNSNSSVKNVVINWGDNTPNFTTSDASAVNGQTHQYDKNKDATYTITAVVTFAVAGHADITAGGVGTACVQSVTFKGDTPPVVTTNTPNTTPPTVTPAVARPTTLVNTGAGSVVGLFALVTVAGALGRNWYLGRRLSN